MAVAVCFSCGARKDGPLVVCRNCGVAPADRDGQAASIALTDEHLSDDELRDYAAHIRNGGSVELDEETKTELLRDAPENVETGTADPALPVEVKRPLSLTVLAGILSVVLFVAIMTTVMIFPVLSSLPESVKIWFLFRNFILLPLLLLGWIGWFIANKNLACILVPTVVTANILGLIMSSFNGSFEAVRFAASVMGLVIIIMATRSASWQAWLRSGDAPKRAQNKV